jgi:two-component system, NtrC family, nitrogen regulation response regulator NtrX
MTPPVQLTLTILLVDDEDSVRTTFREWLDKANLGCQILSAADAEGALKLAQNHHIDLAILDWNLGASDNGLSLLEDLLVFNRDIVAILVTGFANKATPLDALRMGVRDYLDKNQDLDRETFLHAVRRQLDRIRPARREWLFHQGLMAFRDALSQALPLARAASALQDGVPLPEAVRSLFRFLQRGTGASEGALLTRSYDATRAPSEIFRAYDTAGQVHEGPLASFSRSIAGTVVSTQEVRVMDDTDSLAAQGGAELHSFEKGRRSLLAAPLSATPTLQVVLELFDKRASNGASVPFTEQDRQLARSAAEFGAELIRQALAERQGRDMLLEAVGAALEAGERVADSLDKPGRADVPPAQVMERLRQGLVAPDAPLEAGETVRLAEAIRVLAVRYGPPAVEHCTKLVEGLRELLDEVSGAEGSVP